MSSGSWADADAYRSLRAIRAVPGASRWTLSALRGERGAVPGSERRLLDLTLSSPEGRCVVILMRS
jgi:hypothetical protein